MLAAITVNKLLKKCLVAVLVVLIYLAWSTVNGKQLALTGAGGSGSAVANPIAQFTNNANFGTSLTVSVTPKSTANLLVIYLDDATTTGTWATPTGCGTWTIQNSTATSHVRAWATAVPSGTTSCTITASIGGSTSESIAAMLWEVVTASQTYDTSNFAFGFHSSSFSGPSITTATTNEVVLGALLDNGTHQCNVSSPFVADFEGNNNETQAISMSHKVQATAASVSATYVPVSGDNFAMGIIAIKP